MPHMRRPHHLQCEAPVGDEEGGVLTDPRLECTVIGQVDKSLDWVVGGDQGPAEREDQQPDDLGCVLAPIGALVVAVDYHQRHLVLSAA